MKGQGKLREILLTRGRFRFLLSTLLFMTVLSSLVALLSIGSLSGGMELQPGQVSPRTIKAERSVEVVNQKQTQAARQAAADAVGIVYSFDPSANAASENRLNATFNLLLEAQRHHHGKPESARLPELPITLSPRTYEAVLKLSPKLIDEMHTDAHTLLYRVMEEGVRADHIPEARRVLRDQADESFRGLPAEQLQIITEIASECILANRIQNVQATLGAQEAAKAAVKPISTLIPEGAVVVREGEVLSPEQVDAMQALMVNRPDVNYTKVAGYTLLVSLVTVATAAICRSLVALSPYLAPVATASIVLTILVEGRLAMMVTAYLALYVGVMTQSLPATCVAIMAGAAGILALARADKRSHLISATFVVGLLSTTGALVFSLIYSKEWQTSLSDLSFAALNGLISAAIAVGMLPTLEYGFGITTAFRLLDVSNPGEPLLQRLLKEAPGTYQHSIMVANLAESAAQAVGADALRCKVGAYYHDIGKMKRPRFFIENQMGAENPHERLTPSLSTMIIHAHVRDGIEMARQHKLPDMIVDFIAEHHGTSLVTYFFHQACSRASEPMREEDFRYPGPKPQTRETAIVLLCDGLEAAARTLAGPTPEKITELVHKMVKHALEDGQLDECDLSIKDLDLIRESLIRSLQGIYHTRIEYPEPSALSSHRKKVTTLRRKA